MSIDLKRLSESLPALDGLGEARAPAAPAGARPASFADALGKAIGEVEGLQTDADRNVREQALGGGNLHETALALEKADISMRVMTRVRNKLVEAYQEVMRMNV
jgi:flagellar hook-basal body complex protein FliE